MATRKKTRQQSSIKQVNVDGHNIRVVVRKAADNKDRIPLVILNGIAAGIEMLNAILDDPDFDQHEIISYDAPGVGGSTSSQSMCGMGSHAKLLQSLIDKLGYSKVNLLGYSWGGILAQAFAKRYPERCHRLILAATSTGHTMIPGKMLFSPRMANFKLLFEPEYLFDLINGSSRQRHVNPKYEKRQKQRIKVKPSGYIHQWLSIFGWSSIGWLHKIKHHPLVLHARDDQLVSSLNARLLAELLPNCQLELINSGGHMFLLRPSRQTKQILNEFCAV